MRKFTLPFTSSGKRFFIYIYEVFTSPEKEKSAVTHYYQPSPILTDVTPRTTRRGVLGCRGELGNPYVCFGDIWRNQGDFGCSTTAEIISSSTANHTKRAKRRLDSGNRRVFMFGKLGRDLMWSSSGILSRKMVFLSDVLDRISLDVLDWKKI